MSKSEQRAPEGVRLLIESNVPESSRAIEALEQRLVSFYQSNNSYYDCAAEADKSAFFRPVAQIAKSIALEKGRVRMLEVGAGKSTLPEFLSRHVPKDRLDFVAQDINATNRAYYEAKRIPLLVGNIAEIETGGSFDMVVSFFVWEHLTRPARCLQNMCSSLSPGGRLVIVSPKYTSPLYIAPAIRHLSRPHQLLINGRLVIKSLLTLIDRRPKFSIVLDPALFHAGWRRDADAVHMVSRADLRAHLGRAWRIESLKIHYDSAKAQFLAGLMLLGVVISRAD